MTAQADVETALLLYLSEQLLPTYPALKTCNSVEAASKYFQAGTPFVCVTLHDYHVETQGNEHQWQFLVQIASAKFVGAQPTTTDAANADRALVDAVNSAVNGNVGYFALQALGLYTADCKSLPFNQTAAEHINPHIFSCRTF